MILVPHDPGWKQRFEELREVYQRALGGLLVRVEHVGSTAVPGLAAKPILDIDIVMRGYVDFSEIVTALGKLGYIHNGDQGIFQREAFRRLNDEVPFTAPRREWMLHHLYVCPQDGLELSRHVRFRDLLCARDDLRQMYQAAKMAIAARVGEDRTEYARVKEVECRGLIERILGECWHGFS